MRASSSPSRTRRAAVALCAGLALTGGVLTAPAAAAQPAAPAAAPASPASPAFVQTPALPSGRTDYRALADYRSDMAALAGRHPSLVKQVTLPHRTSEGREVTGLEITDGVHRQDGKPVLLITGMHHGNEWASGEVAMEFAFDLTAGHGRDERITRLLDRVRVLVVPIVNVDGFVRNTRRTATNVDMNRNYGFGWSPSEPYPGSGPWSEPESRNVRDAISSRQVTTFLTMHTCLSNMLYPPLQLKAGLPQDIDAFRSFADAMGAQNGYYHTTSAEDYETAGEAIDWSYYATRGLGVTVEVCTTPLGLPRTFQSLVPDQYWGVGPAAGKGNRGAFLVAMEQAADRAAHSTITGHAPKGAVLTISKDFDMWTNPVPQPDGTSRPVSFPNHLTSTMRADERGGHFVWDVNPSVRPIPPYQADGVHGDRTGFLQESWTLTCARPDGTVLQTLRLKVDRGKSVTADLHQCRKLFHR